MSDFNIATSPTSVYSANISITANSTVTATSVVNRNSNTPVVSYVLTANRPKTGLMYPRFR